jgi:hypothetical protein
MKRNYYLAITAMRKFANYKESQLIEIIFPKSDVKEHLTDKLLVSRLRYDIFLNALVEFYESLDTPHQYWFDEWANKEIEATEKKTSPYPDNMQDISGL